MHSEVGIIDVLFRLTIFSLLFIKILQLFKDYVLPYLHNEIKREKAVRTELIEKGNFIKSTQNKVENQIKSQKKLFSDVEKNVQKWHTFLREERDKSEKTIIDVHAKIEKRRNFQRKNYILMSTYTQAIPQAIELAGQDLTNFYLSKNGKQSFDKLIEKL